MFATKIIEKVHSLPASAPANMSGTAMTALWVSLKNMNHIAFHIQTGAWAAGTAAVTINQAIDISGTSSKAVAFTQYWTITGTGTGDIPTLNTAVSNTFNLSTANTLYVIELDAAVLDVSNAFRTVTLAVASPGANADYYGVLYHLWQGQEQALSSSVLTA